MIIFFSLAVMMIAVAFLGAIICATVLSEIIKEDQEKKEPKEIEPQPPEHVNCRCWIEPMEPSEGGRER